MPPGFTISTEVCGVFSASGAIPRPIQEEIAGAVAFVEEQMKARLGNAEAPLLLSVRSGARVSMPGMMDTVLDLGLNDQTVEGLARSSGDRRFALDCYRRLCAMYGGVVLGIGDEPFDGLLAEHKLARRAASDAELGEADLEELVRRSKALILERAGVPLPQDPRPNSRAPSKLSSAPGTPRARSPTGRRTASPRSGERPSPSRRSSSETWATSPPPAWPSRATLPPARAA